MYEDNVFYLRRYGGPYAMAVPMSARAVEMCSKTKKKRRAIVVGLLC